MVLDTSAVAAILFDEPEAEAFALAVERDPVRLLSAGTALEVGIVVEARLGAPGARELDILLHRARVEVVPFTAEQAELARGAWRMWGKVRHPAGWNYGDCVAYALSRSSGEPLLLKGEDFSKTDVRAAADSPR